MALPSTLANLIPPDEAGMVRRIEALEAQQRETLPAIMAAISPMFADINTALADAQTAITQVTAAQADLAAQQATLTVQQASLTAQQASLTAQISRIDGLVGQQVSVQTLAASQSATIGTSEGSYAGLTFTTPAGYTQVGVMAVSSMYAGGTVASVLKSRISTTDGPEMFAFTNAAYASATAAGALSFGSLSGGTTFQVVSRARTTTGSTSAVILTAAIATFTR